MMHCQKKNYGSSRYCQYAALSPTKLTQAAENIVDLYVEKGYFLAEVNWRLTRVENNQVDVTFDITEKEEVSVARIDIIDKSNDPDADAQNPINATYIKNRLETREGVASSIFGDGGTFKADAFERDVTRIGHFYWDRGYIKAKVGSPKVGAFNRPVKSISPSPSFAANGIKQVHSTSPAICSVRKTELMEKVKLKTDEWFSTGLLRKSIESIGRIYKDEGYAYVNITPNTSCR